MNIVVLDGYTLNPGDLSWDELHSLGTCEIHERTAPSDVLARCANADVVLTNKTVLTREHVEALPKLKYIGVLATGTNVVDVGAARERGVPVTNVPAYATASVAQLTFALLLELTLHVGQHSRSVHRGEWTRSPDFCYWQRPLIEIAGLTLGLVGYGSIARAVSRIAVAFGMKVIATTRRAPAEQPTLTRSSALALPATADKSGQDEGSLESRFLGGEQVRPEPEISPQPPVTSFADLETVFRSSDVLSLHCPLNAETKRLVNAESLAWMKPSAFLINTGRGPLVDEHALADALNSERLAGAAVDVLSVEPPAADNPLLHARNCVITPHIGWATRAARTRLMREAVENVRAFLNGQNRNVV